MLERERDACKDEALLLLLPPVPPPTCPRLATELPKLVELASDPTDEDDADGGKVKVPAEFDEEADSDDEEADDDACAAPDPSFENALGGVRLVSEKTMPSSTKSRVSSFHRSHISLQADTFPGVRKSSRKNT